MQGVFKLFFGGDSLAAKEWSLTAGE